MSLSGQEGIDRLLQAEQEATEIVAKARKGDILMPDRDITSFNLS